jgi:hypothetical protein
VIACPDNSYYRNLSEHLCGADFAFTSLLFDPLRWFCRQKRKQSLSATAVIHLGTRRTAQ